MTWWFRRQSLEDFRESAATNVAFVGELRLPKSDELADRLAHILGCEVAFHFGDDRPGDWSPELNGTIAALVAGGEPAAARFRGSAVAVAPFVDTGVSLVLIREGDRLFPGLVGLVLAPTLVFTLACAILGILIGRRMIRPMGMVAGWLPNLDLEPDAELEPLPETITLRADEIGELARALEQTGERIRSEQRLRRESERLATLGRIATSLAHEIKNPVAAIGLHADLLGQRASAEDAESVALIREEVDRITDLVNQWLFVARARPAQRKRHELRALIEGVARRLGPILDHARARLVIDGGRGERVWVEVDAPRVEQVFRNIFINAVQAMPEGGGIRVMIIVEGEVVRVSVEDEGSGFSEEALRRFGEPFFSEREGGMGIGLTLVRDVLVAHGGSVEAGAAARGKGARVICTLPCETYLADES